ncbi:MAG TPA: PRC-barrel domain-containing protein, partial [Chthoniobacterales bacterium]
PTAQLEDLPGMSDVIGHKMVTQSGRLLGAIDDILIDEKDGTVIGFVVGEGMKSKLENIFNSDRAVHGYVRADADLHVGNDLIVVPDDAFVPGDWERPGKDVPVTPPAESVRERTGWATLRPEKAAGTRTWKRRATEGGSAATGSPEVEGWIPGDFAQAFSGKSKPEEQSARETPDLPASPFPPDRIE